MPKAYLLDIEGTTTPIDFVTRTLFPYARAHMAEFVSASLDEEDAALLSAEMAEENWTGDRVDFLLHLMDKDRKSTTLKSIQGKIWSAGYSSGELEGEVYPDVIPAIIRWRRSGARIYIYSSGSILAQKLIFGHLPAGSILDLIDGHFDTTTGPKKEASSYAKIAAEIGLSPGDVMFLSDSEAEVAAAREAGMGAVLISREAEKPSSFLQFVDSKDIPVSENSLLVMENLDGNVIFLDCRTNNEMRRFLREYMFQGYHYKWSELCHDWEHLFRVTWRLLNLSREEVAHLMAIQNAERSLLELINGATQDGDDDFEDGYGLGVPSRLPKGPSGLFGRDNWPE